MPTARARRLLAVATLAALVLAACGGDEGDGAQEATSQPELVAQIASYELLASRPQRFLVGLAENGTGNLVSFGEVQLRFEFLGEGTDAAPVPGPTATAAFLPVAGQQVDASAPGPRIAPPSAGIGVYRARDVTFDHAGFWRVEATAEIGGTTRAASAAFEVVASPGVPAPGQPAPRTDNPVAGSPGVAPESIDSRAGDGEIPDRELHTTSIKAALEAGRPLVVVVSTPVFCVSRFCGPITDSVAALAGTYGDRAAFVHLEVWRNFQAKEVNPSALEWLGGGKARGGLTEPWVFLVGRDGTIRQRFDNVVGDEELRQAVEALVGATP